MELSEAKITELFFACLMNTTLLTPLSFQCFTGSEDTQSPTVSSTGVSMYESTLMALQLPCYGCQSALSTEGSTTPRNEYRSSTTFVNYIPFIKG